jgi:hypothetical protein
LTVEPIRPILVCRSDPASGRGRGTALEAGMGGAWRRVGIAVLVLAAGPLLAACLGGAPPPPQLSYHLTGVCNQTSLQPMLGTPCVGGDVNITMVNGSGGIEQHTVTFPFDLNLTRPPDGFVYISGQLQGDGYVSCQINNGAQIVQNALSTSEFGIATCSGSV